MATRITEETFFAIPAEELAKKLLGKILCHKIGPDTYRWRIVETEAYSDDESFCRTSDDYKSVGKIILDGGNGMNITCKSKDTHDNVLIRGAITFFDSQPYKLMRAFNCLKKCSLKDDYIADLYCEDSHIYIEKDACDIKEENIKNSKRINIQSDKEKNYTIKNPNYEILLSDLNRR